MLLKVQTDFGNHQYSVNKCLEEHEIFTHKTSSKIASNSSKSILMNFDIKISNENLNLITIVEKTQDSSGQEKEKILDLNKIRFNDLMTLPSNFLLSL